MAKRAKGVSKREEWSAKTGRPKSEYPGSSSSKKGGSDKKAEKKAIKKIKKYYEEKSDTAKKTARTKTERLKEDLQGIIDAAQLKTTRASEDYLRNVGNIEENRDFDSDTLKEYVEVNTGRTQEDLDTSLAKETRRYALEYDKINQDLADRGLTFSERTNEKIAKETSEIQKADIQREANRNFQDIARYEAAKTREMDIKYGQQLEEAETTKTRTIEDIQRAEDAAMQSNARDVEDVSSWLKDTLNEYHYGQDTAVATTEQLFEQNRQNNINNQNLINAIGT